MAREKHTTDAVLRSLGRRVAELRRARAWTQEEAAGKLRMLAPNYARIEQGRQNVTVETLVRIANLLEVTLSDLFAQPADPRPPQPGRPKGGATEGLK